MKNKETTAGNRAKKIAAMIYATSSDARGELLRDVATALRMKGQSYTAKGFDILATIYEKGSTDVWIRR
jgi:hypothetical protein